MSLRWPNKDPDELVDYSINWVNVLERQTISAVRWFIEDENLENVEVFPVDVVKGLQVIGQSFTNTHATLYLGLGLDNTEYKITCRVLTNKQLWHERTVRIRIKGR